MSVTPEDILRFWFGDIGPQDAVLPELQKRWWVKDPAFDREIQERFGATLEAAARGDLDSWVGTPAGIAALIIVLDQFTRNTRRDSPAMYANDAQALELTRLLLDGGEDVSLHPAVRAFAYMPLMHSESRLDHERCIAVFEGLVAGAEAAGHPQAGPLKGALDSGRHHRDIVVKWGRFPHRNAILGRESTPEEIEFLKGPGSSF